MPWTPRSFAKHSRKARGKAGRGAAKAANRALREGKGEASAVERDSMPMDAALCGKPSGETLAQLARALGWPKGVDVLMLYAYFDESEYKLPSGHAARLILGGAMATCEVWKELEIEWAALLARHHIAMFHTTRDKHNEPLMHDVYTLTDRYPIAFLGTSDAALIELQGLGGSYGANVVEVLKMTVQNIRIIGDDRVRLVFALNEYFKIGRIARYCEQIQVALPTLDNWSSARPVDCNPLQVADLAAHAMNMCVAGDDPEIFNRLHRHGFLRYA